MTGFSRRTALGLLLAAAPSLALAARRRYDGPPPRGGVFVDVSPLRRKGDNTDADFLEAALPGYLAQYVGGGRSVAVRIDDVYYGDPGSGGGGNNIRAIDTIQGVGRVDGREIPVQSTLQTFVSFPDVGGYGARQRQDLLAQSFAQWLGRESAAAR